MLSEHIAATSTRTPNSRRSSGPSAATTTDAASPTNAPPQSNRTHPRTTSATPARSSAPLAGRSLGSRTKVGRGAGWPCLSNGHYLRRLVNRSAPSERPRRERHPRRRGPARDAVVLLDADPRALVATSKPYVKAFAVAVVGTLCATAIGARFVLPALASALGKADAVGSIASLSAKNIGGGVNFCAVAATLSISAVAQSVALAADNVMALVYFPLCNWLAGDRDPSPGQYLRIWWDEKAAVVDAGSLLAALGTALGILAAASRLSPRAPLPAATLCALGLAAVLPSAKESRNRRRLDRAANVLSETLLYLFFAGAGAAGGARAPAWSTRARRCSRSSASCTRDTRWSSTPSARRILRLPRSIALYLVKCGHWRPRRRPRCARARGGTARRRRGGRRNDRLRALTTFLGLATARAASWSGDDWRVVGLTKRTGRRRRCRHRSGAASRTRAASDAARNDRRERWGDCCRCRTPWTWTSSCRSSSSSSSSLWSPLKSSALIRSLGRAARRSSRRRRRARLAVYLFHGLLWSDWSL